MHTSADGKQTVWQIVIQLHTKLYGSKEDLTHMVVDDLTHMVVGDLTHMVVEDLTHIVVDDLTYDLTYMVVDDLMHMVHTKGPGQTLMRELRT